MPLKAAMNFGKLNPQVEYRACSFSEINSLSYHCQNVVVVNCSDCQTTEKLKEIFKRVDTIITSDIDIKNLHSELRQTDIELALMKSIVLVDTHDMEKLKELVDCEPSYEIPSTARMNMKETLIAEAAAFTCIDKEEIKETVKSVNEGSLSKI